MKFLKFLLFFLGYPVLLALAGYGSYHAIEQGFTYGIWAFVGVILVTVFFLIYLIVFISGGKKAKKRGTRQAVIKSTAALCLVSFIFTAGLWLVIDIVLPDILDDATSGTLLFDDMRESFDDQADINANLLTKFITWNYKNENLDNEKDLDEYLAEGYRNEQVKELIATNFQSIDKDGYKSFTNYGGPWLDLANADRMTIPVIVHLILDARQTQDVPFVLNYECVPKVIVEPGEDVSDFQQKIEREDKDASVVWSILDMAGGAQVISLSGLLAEGGFLSDALFYKVVSSLLVDFGPEIVMGVERFVADEEVANSAIYLQLDLSQVDPNNPEGAEASLLLTSSVEARGMWDYQSAAWLDSNNLLTAVISIFPIRHYMYIWGAMVVAFSVAIGAIRMKQYAKDNDESEEKKGSAAKEPSQDEEKEVSAMNPYDRALYTANKVRASMR